MFKPVWTLEAESNFRELQDAALAARANRQSKSPEKEATQIIEARGAL